MFLSKLFFNQKDKTSIPINRDQCCAFAGHRPEKLYGKEGYVIAQLRKEIDEAVADGYTTFVTGCSRGVDLWAADIVIEMQHTNKDLRLICAIPFPGFEDRWPVEWKKHLQLVEKKADRIEIVEQSYTPGAYQKRNAYMCDLSSRIIAVCDGRPSGTLNTIKYAQANDIPVRLIKP